MRATPENVAVHLPVTLRIETGTEACTEIPLLSVVVAAATKLPGIAYRCEGAFPAPAPIPATSAPEPAAPESDGSIVKSPIVGTFFRAVDPNAAPFVNVGDQVKVGQVLCIIEAMKLMNEIEAEVTGEILRIHPENGQPVQYGDSLFTIRPTP